MYRLLLFACLITFTCCTKKQEQPVSFYYWKTTFALTAIEKQALTDFHTKELYIRFFDVDRISDSLVPVGVLSGLDSVPATVKIIPVVFITNRSFINASQKEVLQLADRLNKKILAMWPGNRKPFEEMQVDCDWSEASRANYFLFLKELKSKLNEQTLSATIRLHQVKYPLRTGIPPVDKGMLMFYNMGNAKDVNSRNSIYNRTAAEKYTGYISAYPLSLDLALPMFSWQLQFRDQKLVGIIPKDDCPDTEKNDHISKTNDTSQFQIKSSFLHKGHYFTEGDILKVERITGTELQDAAQLLSGNKQKNSRRKIVFFDLDEYNLKSIPHEKIEEAIDRLE